MDTDGTQIKTSAVSGNPYAAPQTVVCQQKVDGSHYYLSFRFWLSAFFGWFAAAFLLGAFAALALGGRSSNLVGVIILIVAALIGFYDARWRWNKKNKRTT